MKVERYKKIKSVVDKLIAPSVKLIKRMRKRRSMPYMDIERILNIFFPKTKHLKSGKGAFKHVFVIHSNKRRLVLKIGRDKSHIKKDYRTYLSLPSPVRNLHFAKIYWADGLFMLQKYGRQIKVPPQELFRLKRVGKRYGLTDVREANIMKFGNGFKIIDAEKRK